MPKKSKEKTGRVVMISKENNLLLKQYFIYNERMGVTLSNSDICDQIFEIGLITATKTMLEKA
jgi:hypothetical protein